jgi:hypothetical protein
LQSAHRASASHHSSTVQLPKARACL